MKPASEAPRLLSAGAQLLGACVVIALGALWLRPGPAPVAPPAPAAGTLESDNLRPCILDRSGYLHGQMYGAINRNVDWTGVDVACGGMTRPREQGVRLVFAAPADERSQRLVFVIGIDGAFNALPNRESAANLTIVDERSGRFFGTQGMARCWTTVSELRELARNPASFRIDGELYCAGSIPSLSDNSSVTLSDFHYSGQLTLDDS
jgi:hypothetical protein